MEEVRFKKIAVANRGEVAVRIIKACHELGLKTVLLHSEPDKKSLAYRMSDETYCVGPAATAESYLHIHNNIHGALKMGAQAVHPGFGFLSENAEFAKQCANYGLTFIGPSPEAIRCMGDKIEAKEIARKAGVPVIPGYEGDTSNLKEIHSVVKAIGFPVIVKAAGGGGGRGLKVVRNDGELEEQLEAASREAASSFGNSRVFIEKYFEKSKHIEIQIFGDSHGNVLALGERDCSVQRRHQKIIEEAPSAALTPALRAEMQKVAIGLAKAVKYCGAGTVEFLVSEGKFHFMEMNTRLQVEHPVTELVFGVDLVKAQIIAASGAKSTWRQEDLVPRGHSIECRLYAEDPHAGGIPSTGLLGGMVWPQGPGRRFEVGFEEGDEITSHYDPMIAKIIVWDESRPRAIEKMLRVLDETIIFGVRTNIPLLKQILSHSDFMQGRYNTQFMGAFFPEGLGPRTPLPQEEEIVKGVAALLKTTNGTSNATVRTSPWDGSWRNV